MGHAAPFEFGDDYRPADGIRRFLTGTPPVLAMAALECGLATFDGIAMADIEARSRELSAGLRRAGRASAAATRSPSPPRAIRPAARATSASPIPHGYAVMQALIARGVIGDFRAPDLMRFGFAPLYNSVDDVVRAADILGEIIASGEWDHPRFHARAKVT